MAIPEACGLWIEQRVQEELEQQKETGVSLREIGRTVAAEVEKYFETKVDPDTIRKRAERSSGTNVPKTKTPTAPSVLNGPDGPVLVTPITETTKTTIDPVIEVHKEVVSGVSVREASRKVAEKTGESPQAVRRKYQKNIPKTESKQDQPVKKEKEKKKKQNMQEVFPLSKISKEFQIAYDNFMDELLTAKTSQWEKTSLEAASHCVHALHTIITMGE